MTYKIHVDYELKDPNLDIIRKGLGEFNTPYFGRQQTIPFAVCLKDGHQTVVGGIIAWMRSGMHLLYIDTIWVSENLRRRGFGTQLMLAAEAEGLKHGCTHSQLDTLPFQAEEFYKSLGYFRVGLVEKLFGKWDYIFLRKHLIKKQSLDPKSQIIKNPFYL